LICASLQAKDRSEKISEEMTHAIELSSTKLKDELLILVNSVPKHQVSRNFFFDPPPSINSTIMTSDSQPEQRARETLLDLQISLIRNKKNLCFLVSSLLILLKDNSLCKTTLRIQAALTFK
jgi:hypothetical protein